MNNKISNYLNNLWPITILLTLISILKEVRGLDFLDSVFQLILLFGLIIGVTQILYQLVKIRFQSKFYVLLFLFIATIGISSILNRQALVANVKETAVMAVVLLGGFVEINQLKHNKKDKILNIISKSVVMITLIVSLLSVITFFLKINIDTEFNVLGKVVSLGIYNNRLFGLYQSLTLPIAPIGLIFGILLVVKDGISKNQKTIAIVSIFVNLLYLILSFSSGIIVALAAVIGFFTIVLSLNKINVINSLKSLLLGVILAGLFVGVVFGTRTLVYKLANPNVVSNSNMDEIETPQVEQPGALDKERPYGFLTGRDTIWSYGIENLKAKPLYGYGPQAFVGEQVLGTQKLQHMHSVYVQALVSGGIIHFVPFLAIIITLAYSVLKYVFTRKDDNDYLVNVCLASIIGFLLIHGLIETNFLYVNRFPMYAFWISLALMNINFFKTNKN